MKHHTLGEMNPSESHFNAVPRTPPTRNAHGRTHESLEHTLHTYRKAWEQEKQRAAELEAEVERLRAKVAVVDAMERGEVRIIGWSDDRTRFGLFVDRPDGGEDEVVGSSVLAAYGASVKARCEAAVAGPLDAEGSAVLRDAIVKAIRNA